MANELQYIGRDTESGLTLTVEIYGSDGIQEGSAIAATEVGSTAIYTADMPAAVSDKYSFRFFNGSTVIGIGEIQWNGTTQQEITIAPIPDILADTNELQTNQGNFATATGFATPADVTTAVSGLATQASVDVIDTNVDAILVDTNELQTNQGNFATATGFATPADVTTAVSGLATQASVDTVDANVDAILVDTNELQTNQGNFATATGFATPADVITAVSGLATQASVDTVDANVDAILADTNELQTNQGNFATATGFATPADVTTAVSGLATQASVDTVDANVDAILVDTNELQTNQGNFATATGFATPGDITAAISGLNDPSAADIADAVWDEPAADHTTAGSTGEALQSGAVDLSPVLTAIGNLNDPTASDIYTFFISGNNEDAFKADTSGLTVDLQPVLDAITTQTTTLTGRFDTVDGSLADANTDTDQILVDIAALDTVVDAGFADTQASFVTLDGVVDAGFAATQASFVTLDNVIDAGFTNAATATQVAAVPASVWESLTTVNYGTDSFGEYIKSNLDVPISSSSALVRKVDNIDILFNNPNIEIEIDADSFGIS